MSGWGGRCSCTSIFCHCQWSAFGTTGGRSTNWVSFTVTEPILTRPNAAARWFDCFRLALEAIVPSAVLLALRPWRAQARADHAQRRRHKRRRFLQALMA